MTPIVEWPDTFCASCGARPAEACTTMAGNLRRDPHPGRGADRKAATIPTSVRAAVSRRSGGVCEFDAERHWSPVSFVSPSRCEARAVHKHHVRMRSLGGKDLPSNLADLCPAHHRHVHDRPQEAVAVGLLDAPADRV